MAVTNDPAMTVRGVFAEADVGYNHQIGEFLFNLFYCTLDYPVVVVCFACPVVFMFGYTEEDDGGNAEFEDVGAFFYGFVNRELVDARHR
jgi:hypothetical protein